MTILLPLLLKIVGGIGGGLLIELLGSLGIGASRTAVASQAAKHLLPQALGLLKKRRDRLHKNSQERREIDSVLTAAEMGSKSHTSNEDRNSGPHDQ